MRRSGVEIKTVRLVMQLEQGLLDIDIQRRRSGWGREASDGDVKE